MKTEPRQSVAAEAAPKQPLPGVSVADGKYTIQCDADGRLRCLRYGEPWRDLTGDGMVLALAQEVQSLRGHHQRDEALIVQLTNELRALATVSAREKALVDALETCRTELYIENEYLRSRNEETAHDYAIEEADNALTAYRQSLPAKLRAQPKAQAQGETAKE